MMGMIIGMMKSFILNFPVSEIYQQTYLLKLFLLSPNEYIWSYLALSCRLRSCTSLFLVLFRK